MDRSKINNLLQAFAELDEEITKGIQGALLRVRDTDWETRIPSLQEDCEATMEGIRKAEEMLRAVRHKADTTQGTVARIYDLYKEIHGHIPPRTLGESIAAIVESYFEQGTDMILVDALQKQLADTGIVLSVKNPAAVIASILARDERLEKVDKGKFKKKIPKDLEEQPMRKG